MGIAQAPAMSWALATVYRTFLPPAQKFSSLPAAQPHDGSLAVFHSAKVAGVEATPNELWAYDAPRVNPGILIIVGHKVLLSSQLAVHQEAATRAH